MKRALLFTVFILLFIVFLVHVASGNIVAVFEPKGIVALQERTLIITAVLLMLIVVIPVFILTFFIAWKYRASNTTATYIPDHDHDLRVEIIWWAIPCAIILLLAVITWQSTHALDPYKPLTSTVTPITIQVVALDWKWLFIYPEQGIASVNFLEFPAGTPIDFQITADAPMNSFWIPQLGGQIYAMPGMVTQLHLSADTTESYTGVSANFSGRGFAGMKFTAQSVSQSDFDTWVQSVRQLPQTLNLHEYNMLSKPSENTPITSYGSVDPSLYNAIVMKFLMPKGTSIPSMHM